MSVCQPRGAFADGKSSRIRAGECAFALAAGPPRRGSPYGVSKINSPISGQWSE